MDQEKTIDKKEEWSVVAPSNYVKKQHTYTDSEGIKRRIMFLIDSSSVLSGIFNGNNGYIDVSKSYITFDLCKYYKDGDGYPITDERIHIITLG